MCLCCSAKARTIRREVLPGYQLLQATVDVPGEWPKGWYGLQRYNDPDFIWKQKVETDPIRDKQGGQLNVETHDKEFRAFCKWDTEVACQIEKQLKCDPDVGYDFVKACKKAGYRKRDGRLSFWLVDHIARRVKRWIP